MSHQKFHAARVAGYVHGVTLARHRQWCRSDPPELLSVGMFFGLAALDRATARLDELMRDLLF